MTANADRFSTSRVSVVIPTYNRARLVDQCIHSLKAAEIDGLEVVVVDDGGSDETPAVAARHGAIYVRQANAGPAAGRNNGASKSSGRYLLFIDSDDEWINGGAGRLANLLDENPDIPLVFADSSMGNASDGFVSFVREYGGEAFFRLPHQERRGGLRVLERRSFFRQLSTRNVMFLASLLVRREHFLRLGGFDESLRGAADWEFFMRATVSGPVAFSDGPPTSIYFKHGAGMSTDADHMEEDFIKALDAVRRRAPVDDVERNHLDERLRAHVFHWAWDAYDRRDFGLARQRLLLGRAMGEMGFRELCYLAITVLPPPVVSGVRRLWRAF